MPSIFKSLLGGSAKSQSSGKKLKKGASTRSQRPPHSQAGYDQHHDERGSAYSDEMHGKEKHSEFAEHLPLRPIHPSRAQEHAVLGASDHYPDMTYAATRYPAHMPRYELYDPGGPGPLPVASIHHAPSHEFHEQRSFQGAPGAPSIHYYPSNFQPLPVPPPRSHPDASWEPIPDVRRESTIADPEAYHHHEMQGYDSEEERWMRAQGEEHTPPEGYGRFVTPGRVRSDHHSTHRSVQREEIMPQHVGEGEWEWTDNRSHNQLHARAPNMVHTVPSQSPIHREDMDRVHDQPRLTPAPSLRHQHSVAEQRSNRLSTGSGSKFQEHLVSPEPPDRRSLKKKLSNIFNKGAEEQQPHNLGPGIARSHSRKSGVEARASMQHMSMQHLQAPVAASRHSQISTDSFEEEWREDGDVYQYIVPPGVNIIFKDKHGNEITRVGDYPDSALSKRRSRRSAPIVVIDQNGKVLYDEGNHRRIKSPEGLRSSSPRSAGSGSSSPSAKTILISPKGDQFQLGGSATSRSSGSGSQRGREDPARQHRR